jgi:hypothetical protein
LLLQQCDAAAAASAPPFVSMMPSNNNNNNNNNRRTRIIIDPHHLSDDEMMMMTNDNNSKTLSSSFLSSDEDDGSSTTSTVYNLKATTISSSISNCGKGVLKHLRAGGVSSSPSSSPLLSTIFTIVAQTLNVATAAIVASGYLGCWIASFIIQQLHHHQHQQLILSGSDILHQVKTWKWTICATITHILFNNNNNNNNILQMKNTNSLVFLLSLWIYSYMVNTTLGGYIGCTHVILGVISSVMGSSLIINRVSDFMNVRLPPLDDNDNGGSDDDDNDSSMLLKKSSLSREEEKSSRGSSSSSSVSVREDVLVRFMSSLSIFTSFPQDCLSLYLGSSALITWVSSLDLNSSSSSSSSQLGMMVWKVVGEKWLPWCMDGLVGNHDMIGKDGATTTMMVIETKSVSMRLFALHVIIMLIKGTTALLLQL